MTPCFLQHLSLGELLQEPQNRLQTPGIPSDQQQELATLAIHLLQASVSDTEPAIVGDLSDIKEQAHVKRALEVAAAGGHHLALIGPHGAGKTRLARTLPCLMGSREDALPFREVNGEHETTGLFGDAHLLGEIILASGGVLLLTPLERCSPLRLSTLASIRETTLVASGLVRLPGHYNGPKNSDKKMVC